MSGDRPGGRGAGDGLVAPHIGDLESYPPGKPIDEVEREYGIKNAIKLASNENPHGPSPRAVEALRRRMAELHLYPDAGGFYLRRAIAERHGVSMDEVLLGNGSNEIIEIACHTFGTPADHAVIADHTFVMFRIALHANAVPYTTVPLQNWTYDLDAMAAAVTPKTKLLFIANPNNPTGTYVDRARLERFFDVLPPRVVVVMDEAYIEYVRAADFPDSLALRGRRERLLTLRTFSKIYGMAGLRLGYAIARKELITPMNQVREPFNVNVAAQIAGLAALGDADHVERSRRTNAEGIEYLSRELAALGCEIVPSQGNFLLVGVGRPGPEIYEQLLRRGIIVRPLVAYGLPRHLRITVGLPEQNRRLVAAMKDLLTGPR